MNKCPKCNIEPFDQFLPRQITRFGWFSLRKRTYAIICRACKEIVGYEDLKGALITCEANELWSQERAEESQKQAPEEEGSMGEFHTRTFRDREQVTPYEEGVLSTNKCPDCMGSLLEGPHGGGSINVKCEGCGSKFNIMTPFTSERISDASPNVPKLRLTQ